MKRLLLLQLILFFGEAQLLAQVSPEIIAKNNIHKAFYYETRLDTNGGYIHQDKPVGVAFFNNQGDIYMLESISSWNGKDAINRDYYLYNKNHNKIESYSITQKPDSTFRDTSNHYKWEYRNDKLFREFRYRNGRVIINYGGVTSYHYIRKGFYFTYQAISTHDKPYDYELVRKEYRSSKGVDSTITINYQITRKNHGKYDTLIVGKPDTAIVFESETMPSGLLSSIKNKDPKLNIIYNSLIVHESLENGKKELNKVEFFNELDQIVLFVIFRSDKTIYRITSISYNQNNLFNNSETKIFRGKTKWTRRVEYEAY